MASFAVPASVSILVLFRERPELTRAFLRELAPLTGQRHHPQLLLADAASGPATRNVLANCRLGSVQFFSANLGFARGNNRLAQSAEGEILVFLTYDVQFTPGWLEELLAPFVDRPELGIVGNVQLSVCARQVDHCGIFFDAKGEPRRFRPELAAIRKVPLLPAPAVTSACLAIRRSLFEQLGGFDTSNSTGFEDIDLCLRARRAGAEIAVATRSVLWRRVGSSPESHYDRKNADHFLARWGDYARELSRYQPPHLHKLSRLRASYDPRRDYQSLQGFVPTAAGFTEHASYYQLYRSRRFTRIAISLPPLDPAAKPVVRIDPSAEPGHLHLGGVTLRADADHRLLWQARGGDLDACCHPAGSARRLNGTKGWRIESTGTDPQILIWLPPALGPILAKESTTLYAWLRWDPSPSEPGSPVPERRSWFPWPRSTRRRRKQCNVAVDLTPFRPGGVDGETKKIVLTLIKDLATRHEHRLRFRVAAFPALIAELETLLDPCAIMRYTGLDILEEPRLFDGIDVLYAPLGRSRLFRAEIPRVSLIPDLLHRDRPDLLPPVEAAVRERWSVETLASSDLLQCNSQFVVDRLHHHYGIEADRTLVVYNAIHPRTGIGSADASAADRPYFVYPAEDRAHKNHIRLIEAYRLYRNRTTRPWRLKLSGCLQQVEKIRAAIVAQDVSTEVDVLDHLSESESGALLRSAGALVFPSHYEGFGAPVVEAFAAGVPVVCSHTTSLPEIGGDACGYFDPNDAHHIADMMLRVAEDVSYREHLRAAGVQRARRFSFATEADKLATALLRIAQPGRDDEPR